jgi:hypothetical protein
MPRCCCRESDWNLLRRTGGILRSAQSATGAISFAVQPQANIANIDYDRNPATLRSAAFIRDCRENSRRTDLGSA